jgi:hypothetical protein
MISSSPDKMEVVAVKELWFLGTSDLPIASKDGSILTSRRKTLEVLYWL